MEWKTPEIRRYNLPPYFRGSFTNCRGPRKIHVLRKLYKSEQLFERGYI
jgi:hypothetical protein